jgi:hypothetical protein
MFYVFVLVTSNNVSLRNMTTNLRGSDDIEGKIDSYLNSVNFDEPLQNYGENEKNEDKIIPDNINLQEYLSERNWKNIIGKHLITFQINENNNITE